MLSKKERKYVENPEEFKKRYSQGYVDSIKHRIRGKVIQVIEDLYYIWETEEKEKVNDRDGKVGRNPKGLMPMGTTLAIDAMNSLHKYTLTEDEKKAYRKYIIETLIIALYSHFKGSKSEKLFLKWQGGMNSILI